MALFRGRPFCSSRALLIVSALVALTLLECVNFSSACGPQPPLSPASFYQLNAGDVGDNPLTLINTIALEPVANTNQTVFRVAIPFSWSFYGVVRPELWVSTAGFVSFSPINANSSCSLMNPNDPVPECKRPDRFFTDTDPLARERAGFEGIAASWSRYSNVNITAEHVRDGNFASISYLSITWSAEDTLSTGLPGGNSLGPAVFSLKLVNNGAYNRNFYLFWDNLPATSETNQYLSGPWRHRDEPNEWCLQQFNLDNSPPFRSYSTTCGDGQIQSTEECDSGLNTPACLFCICQAGYHCSGNITSALPKMSTISSLLLYGVGRVPSIPIVSATAYRLTLPVLTSTAQESSDSLFPFPSTEQHNYCSVFTDTNDATVCASSPANTNIAAAYFLRDGVNPSVALAFKPNGTTYFSVVSTFASGATLIGASNDGTGPYVANEPQQVTSSFAVGCDRNDLLYVATHDTTVGNITVKALSTTTGAPVAGYGSFSFQYSPPSVGVGSVLVAVNTTSRNVFVFVHDPQVPSQSAVYELSRTLAELVNRSSPWGQNFGFDSPIGVKYFPHVDAFAFSLATSRVGNKASMAFRLGWPAQYETSVARLFNAEYPQAFQGSPRDGNFNWLVANDFCCPQQCYSGSCNSTAATCSCSEKFSGTACTSYSYSIPNEARSQYAVIYTPGTQFSSTSSSINRCANPSTGNTLVELTIGSSTVPIFSTTSPFRPSGAERNNSVLPGLLVPGAANITANISGLYCSSFDLPLGYSSGDPRYGPFFTFVEILPLRPNALVSRTFVGDEPDLESRSPSDPIIYKVSPVITSSGATHSINISSSGLCVLSYLTTPFGGSVPPLVIGDRFGPCVDNSTLVLGDACPRSGSFTPVLGQDTWILITCGPSQVNISYVFVPPPSPITNCSSQLGTIPGLNCTSVGTVSTLTLTGNTTVPGDVYIPPNTTVVLGDFQLSIQGELIAAGTFNTTWYLNATRVSNTTKRAEPAASLGTIGSISVSGCANLEGSALNILIDSSSLPPGSATSQQTTTDVAVFPVQFDCGGGNLSSQTTTITKSSDPCVEHKVKNSQASTQKTGLQVLFSFETTPTNQCGNSTAPGAQVLGNDLSTGLIVGITVAAVGAFIVIIVIIYNASPSCRSKTTPFRGTQV